MTQLLLLLALYVPVDPPTTKTVLPPAGQATEAAKQAAIGAFLGTIVR